MWGDIRFIQTAGLKEIDVQEKETKNDVPLIVLIGKNAIWVIIKKCPNFHSDLFIVLKTRNQQLITDCD